MRTVHEVSKLTGVSIRTLQYYDKIGLLSPTERTEAGYRLYDDAALERLGQILLFRELEFPLAEIRDILDAPVFDRDLALRQQIDLLILKKERLDRIIGLARDMQKKGEITMDFKAFDESKIEEYATRAKAAWGTTKEYAAYTEKAAGRTTEDYKTIAEGLMAIFAEFGALREQSEDAPEVQALVVKLRDYISEHYYPCSNEMLGNLGKMYAAEGEFRENIDKAGGKGTAAFASNAIAVFLAANN
ncbi:MAG: MerR family transcriptional regulator [Oscillospiraceae bacterium]|nr:MerR family transcriptional regulator [Oscillospiraceae bacterium]